MTNKNNAARVAVQAKPCQKTAPMDCSSTFGMKFPEDVIAPIRVGQERFTWLEHLFSCIADDPGVGLRAKRLAEMGSFVASEAADFADVSHTDMLEVIKNGGAA